MSTVTLLAVGDLMFGDSPQVYGFGVASAIKEHGADYPLSLVCDRLNAADITIGNLEVPLSTVPPRGTPFRDRIYRGDPKVAESLARAGFDAVSVCTNHTMQHGQRAFEDTVRALLDQGIKVIGADYPPLGLRNHYTIERRGLRVGFLGFNFRPVQYRLAPPAWPAPDLDLICDQGAAVRKEVDLLVVSLHWGDEFIDRPSPRQVQFARSLIDSGFDIVLGHHPHILQGVECHGGGVIAYSLGNFVFDQWQPRLRRSAILRLEINGPRQISHTIEPIMINDSHQPAPQMGPEAEKALRHLAELGERIGSLTEIEYQKEVASNLRRFRREIYWHYLTRLWRKSPTAFAANVAEIVRRRIS